MRSLAGENPFLRYRFSLDVYAEAIRRGWSDGRFVDLVGEMDSAIAAVAGTGFRVTPLTSYPELADALGLRTDWLWVKDETGNVGGSHKARHLFGTALWNRLDEGPRVELGIASCGNAAVAAAMVARALGDSLRVFVPTWAEPEVLVILDDLGATVERCERYPGEVGDPPFLRFEEAVSAGLTPFSVQASVTPTTIDGGRTIGFEIAEQLHRAGAEETIRLMAQVGGGALASAAWLGLTEGEREWGMITSSVIHGVQTRAAAPLPRAWDLLSGTITDLPLRWPARASHLAGRSDAIAELELIANAEPGLFMQPWENPGHSVASGILDDVTHDWMTVVFPMIRSGGWPVVVSEEQVIAANRLGKTHTAINASATGTAGMAGLLDPETSAEVTPEDHVVVLFTGVDRADG
jgi:threonine synthase